MTANDFAAAYARARDGLIEQLLQLDDGEATTMVAGCPEWSVRDVIAHVAGLVADLLGGIKPPLGSPEMTARQVAERANATMAAICDEWANNSAAIAALMIERPMVGMGLTADLTVHHDDIAEVVGSVSAAPAEAVAVACERYVPLLQERLAERLDLALTVNLDDQTWEPIGGATPRTLTAGRTDFLRAIAGRRSRVAAERTLTWDADATTILDSAFLQYGNFRS